MKGGLALILIVQCRTLHADLNRQMLVQKGNTQRISEVHRAFSLFVLFFFQFVCLFALQRKQALIPKAQKEKETVILGVVLQPVT